MEKVALKGFIFNFNLTGLVFLYIYGPPFSGLPINISTLIFFPLLLIALFRRKMLRNFSPLLFKWEMLLLIFMLSYSCILAAYSQQLDLFFLFFVLIIFSLPSAYLISNIADNHQSGALISALINAAFIAALISICLMFYPELNHFVKFSLLKYDEELMQYQLFRGFGLSDELLFSYSITQSVALYFCLISKKKIASKAIYGAAILISIAVNAKIGLVCSLIVFIIAIIKSKMDFKKAFKFIAVISTFFIFLLNTPVIGDLVGDQLFSTVNEISGGALDDGAAESSTHTLLNEMLFIPNNVVDIVFGNGLSIFGQGKRSSDSGWVLIIHYGGLFFFVSTLILILACVIRLINIREVGFAFVFVAVFFLANTKGLFFAPKPGLKTLALVYFSMIIGNYSKPKRIFAVSR